ncbi:MAG TPA: hypothetical protein VIR57_07380 [Chloroflexota bacterium]
MPSADRHRAQARRNARASEDFQGLGYHDWAVTALFYSAIHWIDAYLATLNVHSYGHVQQARYVEQIAPIKPLLRHLSQLQRRSEDARYQLLSFTSSDVDGLRQEHLGPVTKQP